MSFFVQILEKSEKIIKKKRLAQFKKFELASLCRGIGGFGAKIFVIRSEGVLTYVERAKTEIENDLD